MKEYEIRLQNGTMVSVYAEIEDDNIYIESIHEINGFDLDAIPYNPSLSEQDFIEEMILEFNMDGFTHDYD